MDIFSPFASFVGLICNFRSENRAISDDEYKEFMEWLEKKRHKAVIAELNSNHLLSLSIKSLLNQNQEVMNQKLSDLDRAMTQLVSQVDGLKDVAQAINPNAELSKQAVSILVGLRGSDCSSVQQRRIGFFDVNWNSPEEQRATALLEFSDGSGAIEINEPKFLQDDLNSLCKLGLLIPEPSIENHSVYTITRSAIGYLKMAGK